MKVHRFLIVLALGLAVTGCGERIQPPPTPAIPTMPAPHFVLPDLSGEKVSSDSLAGRIVILNFWASWGPGCVREIPEWVALQSEYEKKGVTFVGINVDAEGEAVAKPYAEKRGINYPILLGHMDLGAEFGGLDAIPSTFIIDRDWNIVNRYTGLASSDSIRSEIYALLQKDRHRSLDDGISKASPTKPGEDGPSPYAPKIEESKEPEPMAPAPEAPALPEEPVENAAPVAAEEAVPSPVPEPAAAAPEPAGN